MYSSQTFRIPYIAQTIIYIHRKVRLDQFTDPRVIGFTEAMQLILRYVRECDVIRGVGFRQNREGTGRLGSQVMRCHGKSERKIIFVILISIFNLFFFLNYKNFF